MGSGKGAVLRGGDSSQSSASGHSLIIPASPAPTGLANVGNTCYANAALQCLLNTALTDALLEPKACEVFRRYSSNPYLLSQGSGSVDESDDDEEVLRERAARREERRKAREDRRMQDTCTWLTRALTRITKDYADKGCQEPAPSKGGYFPFLGSSSSSSSVVDPGLITRYPDRLASTLRPYQQEDAHEFLRAMLSTLVMNGHNRKLSSLFDGLLESAVTFQSCRHTSLTRDRYMDLSLDISHDNVKTLPDALKEFTKTEMLDMDNTVLCDKCGEKQQVSKGLRLATAPSILVCHLKRFAIDRYGRLRRLHKHVRFPLRLEIGDYMSRVNKSTPPPYELVGVLVHQGRSCNSGHYLAYVKSGNQWFKTNDSMVSKVDVTTVVGQQAYILLYEVAGMRAKHMASRTTKLSMERPSTPETIESWDPAASSDDDAHDHDSAASSLLSLLCGACNQAQTAFVTGEFCCGPPSTVQVSSSSIDDDITMEEPPPPGSPPAPRRRRRRYRSKRSISSSNLRELEDEASKAYSTGIPARLPSERSRPRTQSFSHHSDPGGKGLLPRRSKSARRYSNMSPGKEKSLPPLHKHKRHHSHGRTRSPPRSPR